MEEADEAVVRVVSFVDVIPVPWRNGAGLTRAVAEGTEPPWRLSIASLSGVSAFSQFPDHDRTFLIASPGVVTIDVDGVRQGVGFGQSLAFPGEAHVTATTSPAGGSAVNLIVARGSATGRLQVLCFDGAREVSGVGLRAVIVLAGEVRLPDGSALGPLDAVLVSTGPVRLQGRATVVQVVVTASPLRPRTGAG